MRMLAGPVLLLAVAVAGLSGAVAGEPGRPHPAGISDFTNAETLAHFTPIAQWNLWGNPDFPVLLIEGVEALAPVFVLVVMDARNGKETWSIVEDPMILIMVGQGEGEDTVTSVDEGFVTRGIPSGTFVEVAGATLSDVAGLLEAGYVAAVDRTSM